MQITTRPNIRVRPTKVWQRTSIHRYHINPYFNRISSRMDDCRWDCKLNAVNTYMGCSIIESDTAYGFTIEKNDDA